MSARIAMAASILVATYLGLNPPGFAAETVALAFGIAAASIFPILMMGIFTKRVNNRGAVAGMLAGLTFTLVYVFVLVAGGVAAQWLAFRFALPAIVLLFLAGLMVGPVLGLIHPHEALGENLHAFIGLAVALIGAPNAGKSSLLNKLARREAAIVTDIPGTTRDVVEVRLVLGGFPVILADTAGLREAADQVEAEGVRRALARAEDADIRLGVVDVSRETSPPVVDRLRRGDALVLNKTDLAPAPDLAGPDGAARFEIAATDGAGLDRLEAWLAAAVRERLSQREAPALSRLRHRQAVERAKGHLSAARSRKPPPRWSRIPPIRIRRSVVVTISRARSSPVASSTTWMSPLMLSSIS